MPVIVTGASGFVGRHVVPALARRGHDVVAVDRVPGAPGPRQLVADLAEPDPRLDDLLRSATGVVHLAGCPGVRDARPDVARRRWRDNVLAGERALELAPLAAPVVVASSSSVYGGAGSPTGPRPCHEDDPARPRGGYARSKVVLEQRCAERAGRGGLVGVVRPFTVAGEGQRPDMAFSRWIAALRADREVVLLGGGSRLRDVTDVRDVAEGVVQMLERSVTTTVNLGAGVAHRLDVLLHAVADELGVEPRIVSVPAGDVEVAATLADVRRCRRLLGFTPATDLPGLVARQIAATPPDGVPTPAAAHASRT